MRAWLNVRTFSDIDVLFNLYRCIYVIIHNIN